MTAKPLFSLATEWSDCTADAGSSRWLQEHRRTRNSDDAGEHSYEHWINRLKIQNTKVHGVNFEQPEGINFLLLEPVDQRPRAECDQQCESGNWNKPTMNFLCAS